MSAAKGRPPFRADHVGSLLRPAALRQAFRRHAAKEIGDAEFAELQDQCIRDVVAMHLYEQAIRFARENGFIHNEGIANEVAGKFYLDRGFETIAHTYFRNARYCYLRWGATGKVRQLDELYPSLREEEPMPGPTRTIGAPVFSASRARPIMYGVRRIFSFR